MKSILLKEFGDANVMYIGESPMPELKSNEVLVKVSTFAINRADILQRKGKYPSPEGASPLMGLEIAGTVVDANNSNWEKGQKVFGLLPGGGYAEFAAADKDLLMPIPENFSFEEAAAIPEVFLTAYLALKGLGNLTSGETVLIHAASGGVGTAAIQLSKQMGAKVVVTASLHKHGVCKKLGAGICIDYKEKPWAEELISLLGKNAVNLVVDFLGASYFSDNINVLSMDGRLIMLALIGGGEAANVDLRKIVGKRLKIEGSTLRNRSLAFQQQLCADFFNFAMPLFKSGKLYPVIDCVMDWEKIVEAHERMEANQHVGKIIMRCS